MVSDPGMHVFCLHPRNKRTQKLRRRVKPNPFPDGYWDTITEKRNEGPTTCPRGAAGCGAMKCGRKNVPKPRGPVTTPYTLEGPDENRTRWLKFRLTEAMSSMLRACLRPELLV